MYAVKEFPVAFLPHLCYNGENVKSQFIELFRPSSVIARGSAHWSWQSVIPIWRERIPTGINALGMTTLSAGIQNLKHLAKLEFGTQKTATVR